MSVFWLSCHLPRGMGAQGAKRQTHSTAVQLHSVSVPRTLVKGIVYNAEETVRRSRFMAQATHASSWEEAEGAIERLADPKARHTCCTSGFFCGPARTPHACVGERC